MITLRCTARAAKALHFQLLENPSSGTSPLGDWYVNLIPTAAGGMFLFVNEQSLLAVVVPAGVSGLLHMFVERVGNLLSMIGLPNERIERELEHFREARAAKTASRRVLGAMNELASQVQVAFDEATPQKKVSLSDLELYLARIPLSTIGFRRASEMALELLESSARHGAV